MNYIMNGCLLKHNKLDSAMYILMLKFYFKEVDIKLCVLGTGLLHLNQQ